MRADSQPVAGVMIALVPKDPEAHRELFRRDQSDFDGSFVLRGVIPGSYTIVAVEDAWGFQWMQPGVLGRYVQHGQNVTIGELMKGSVRLPDPDISFRASRFRWVGHPTGRPSVASRKRGNATKLFVSWNGATQVANYRVLSGTSKNALSVVTQSGRRSFETVITVTGHGPFFEVQALDAQRRVLGTSRVLHR